MQRSQLTRRGNWEEQKLLGTGGFGMVTLWQHKETGEQLALKICRVQNEMTEKHRHRWKLEIDIMKRLQHDNVITALNVPPELDVPRDTMPVLAMEYCSGGDLRR
ncbi:inhibitor of nuclear factor kappa-B kinase subunit alpha-like, partial [Gigantopelta aegis]|uniref:inhibitor of nuclear factor kappa-B kinase subunit alpha-like n=1 Tax=Gigantopelta aegis TaxID=1735272 RepID=UPI001B888CD1